MTDLETGAAAAAPDSSAIAPAQTAEIAEKAAPSSPMERIASTMSEAYDKINPPRENGKFAAKDKPAEAVADVAAPAAEIKDQNPADVKVEPPAVAAIDAPLSWSAEMKAKFASLPPDAQTYIAQREGEAHKRISELGQQVKAVEPIRNVVEHYADTFKRNNLDPADGIARMLNVEAMLERDAAGTIREIAKAYGVDLSGGQQAALEPGSESERYRALEAKYSALERRLGETASKITARERSEAEQEQATLNKTISDFAKDKPHFEKVRVHMSALMQSGAAQDLSDAYDMAVYAVPDIRKGLLDEQRKAEDEKRDKERTEKAKDAKRVGSLNVKSTSASPAKKGSWEDTLRETGERLVG
jgi:hypothetical protein